ncbi:MAG: hypothetical protein CL543_10900 [Alcanivorax sp.]|nr:hypothetical protein [Alcanivorax sp.]MBI55367.1 hypothetical protein [Alcanivorax sp.]MBU59377.1 hypothetical protein [Alcanivorax sp.]UWN50326.1 hypothetical protein ASALC70_02547 [Alcanivorax sp. ALC70]|tara:strand:+ start:1082 stop:1417 length:336 start_codon:yes stop_codon:yes gene_type:complete
MKKTLIVSCLLIGSWGPTTAMAADDGDCMRLQMALSDVQMALAGMGDLGPRLAKLEAMSDQVPALKAPLDDLVEVVKAADDDRPVETIDMDAYDRAEAAYQKKYRAECGAP